MKIFETPRFEVHRKRYRECDNYKDYYFIKKPDAVAIILEDTDQQIYLCKNERFITKKCSYELFGGRIEKGETPYECAKRELGEESGVHKSNMNLIQEYYPLPSLTTEKIYLFKAVFDATTILPRNCDLDENIFAIEKFRVYDCKQLIKKNMINNAADAYALLLYLLMLEDDKKIMEKL